MNFVVCVKLTPDTESLGQIAPAVALTEEAGVPMVLNPWDEFAVEEALRQQESLGEGAVTAVTLGGEPAVEALRRAVAMGAGSGLRVADARFARLDTWGKAHVMAAAIRTLPDVGIVFTGRQSVDNGSGMFSAGLADALGWPLVSSVSAVVSIENGTLTVRRSLDEDLQTVQIVLPAVVSVSKEINEPRFPSFLNVRKAARATYPVLGVAELPALDSAVLSAEPALEIVGLEPPARRSSSCEFIGGSAAEQAAALVERLIADKLI
jgi:electron transfer flavoprotein beta subunit